MKAVIQIILIGLLLGCLFDMPYAYFQFVRFASTAGFAYLAYEAFDEKNQRDIIIFFVLALLFQPFEKIALGRVLWNIVDVGVAVYLLLNLKQEKHN